MAQADIFRAYNFRLDIQGTVAGYFSEVSGLEVNVAPIAYREGGAAPGVRYLPGRVDIGEITLKYGLTSSKYLWDWLMTGVQGKVDRRNVSVIVLSSDGSEVASRWNLTNSWVTRWCGAELNAMAQQAAFEKISLVAESIECDRGN